MQFFVYILASSTGVLYIGVTRDLPRRIYTHRFISNNGFVHRYKVHRLIYYENSEDVISAIAREKQLKRWTRKRKLALIRKVNPNFEDLAKDWFNGPSPPSHPERSEGSP